MSDFAYVAVDPRGSETRGTLNVADQSEALRRIREMGLYPTRILPARTSRRRQQQRRNASRVLELELFGTRVKTATLAVFTRQLATLIEAGMPLLRGLRTLQQQEENRCLKRVIGELSDSIEGGASFADAIAAHPKVFNRLYANMVKAGEVGGILDTTLKRLAEFMEKAQRIKGRIKSAMFYPVAVLIVAAGILVLLMSFVVPRFAAVFSDLSSAPLPPFTLFVFGLSKSLRAHLLPLGVGFLSAAVLIVLALKTTLGRWTMDRIKIALPAIGPLFRKVAISRFARTLGTLTASGVPILQALTIVKETAGNLLYAELIGKIHDRVKEGEPLSPTLRASSLFPVMVAGMVDVGEETGALPDMLVKIADTYDEEVDNAATALTSLLEPIMIVFLAIVVVGIVIAMFLPLIDFIDKGPGGAEDRDALTS